MTWERDDCYHTSDMCAGELCCFHNPSDHKMNQWPMHIRLDRGGLTERICEHGVGHPDPDSLNWLARIAKESNGERVSDGGVHGCDGCCLSDKGFASLPLLTYAEGEFNPGFQETLHTDAITQFAKYQFNQTQKIRQIQRLERIVDLVLALAWIAVIYGYVKYFSQS